MKMIKLLGGYIIFAGIAAIVDLGLLFFLTSILGLWYFFSAATSYLSGMIINFTLNKYLNFKNTNKRKITQFGLFSIIACIGLILNQFILFILVEYFGFWYITAKIFSMIVVLFWNFFGHKKITFEVLK